MVKTISFVTAALMPHQGFIWWVFDSGRAAGACTNGSGVIVPLLLERIAGHCDI